MARGKIQARVSRVRAAVSPSAPKTAPTSNIVQHVNESDRKHKRSFTKNPPHPVPPSKNAIQHPRPVKGK